MGKRIYQVIYTCDNCGEIPGSGEPMWYMGNEVWCTNCVDEAESQDNKQINAHDFAVAGCYNDTCKGDDKARKIEITYLDGMYESGGDKFEEGIYIFFAPHDAILKFESVKELCSVREQFRHIINQLT